MEPWLAAFLAHEALPAGFADTVERVAHPLADRIAGWKDVGPLVVGICGTQGSGKSTLSAVLVELLGERGLRAVVLALDDLYRTRAARRRLAANVHPLFVTRGPPGTHDVTLGLKLLDSLARPGDIAMPRFEKALDDRAPPDAWPVFQGPADVILFEGWCVGARPQAEAVLADAVNTLEHEEDPQGVWRTYANAALAGAYQTLFARLDRLILLKAPSFETVLTWRIEQEAKLRARLSREGADPARTMTDAEIARFIAHYERLTRHILAEMPDRADVVVPLDAERRAA